MEDPGRSGPQRLAQLIERIGRERRPERLALTVLDAAISLTGAHGGRIVGPTGNGRTAQLALDGAPGAVDAAPVAVALEGRDGSLGSIELWGVDAEPDLTAALRILAAHYAGLLEVERLSRIRTDDRRRARRLAAAALALRATEDPRDAIAVALADARALTATPVAVLVAAGSARLETAAVDGLERLEEREIAALVPRHVRVEIAQGGEWRGPLGEGNPLCERGFQAAAVAAVGDRASLGYLAVLSEDPYGISADELEALTGLAGHTASALTTVVLQREIRDLGTVDPLTRFFNARYFRTRLEQECQRARRTGGPLSVAVLSLDGLREVRGEGRASSGDAAMRTLSTHIAARLRGMDIGCRVGEDELAAILPEVEGMDAFRVGERLRASLREDPLLSGAFTLSVGVASFPDQAAGPDELFTHARQAMSWARLHGGDRTFLFHREAAAILDAEQERRSADEQSLLTTLFALADTVDQRHPTTVGHSVRVGELCELVARELGLRDDRAARVAIAGRLHDLGKAGMRRDIVVGADELTDGERDELRRHPEIGARMLNGSEHAPLGPWVYHHHERMDGGGYPDGLSGETIPLEARIIAAADRFDRLVNGTPTRGPLGVDDALARLEQAAGDDLDIGVGAAGRAVVRRGLAPPGAPEASP